MIVSEVKRQRQVLENQIKVLVSDFENRTGVTVEKIHNCHIDYVGKQSELVSVDVELSVPRY